MAETGEAIALALDTGRATVFVGAASALAQAQVPSPFQSVTLVDRYGTILAIGPMTNVLAHPSPQGSWDQILLPPSMPQRPEW